MKKVLLSIIFVAFASLVMGQGFYDLLKTDVGMKRRSLVKKHLELSDAEGKIFWPMFEEYLEEVTDFYDSKRKDYQEAVEAFTNLDEAKAEELGRKFFDFTEERMAMKRRWFDKMNEELSAVTVIKFFQIDYQIDLLIDVQIAGEVPLIDEGF